jgi:hypothetical protein
MIMMLMPAHSVQADGSQTMFVEEVRAGQTSRSMTVLNTGAAPSVVVRHNK